MNKFLLATLIVVNSCPMAWAQSAGFAPPNAYGNPGSYYGGAGYSHNFGFNTIPSGYVPSPVYTSPYAYGGYAVPVVNVPQPIGNGLFNVMNNGTAVRYWRSPSGYYYPWVTPAVGYTPSIIYMQSPNQATQQAPPISTMLSDLRSYLDEQKEKGRIAAGLYEHLQRRAGDLQSKYADLRTESGGSLDPQDERQMRLDLDNLSAEVAKAVHSQ